MEKKLKKLPAVAPEDFPKLMEAVTQETMPLLDRKMTSREIEAANIFFGTLVTMTFRLFDYLPSGQQKEIQVTCGEWLDIGMLLGKSPLLLVEILNKVNPKVAEVEIPDWLAEILATTPDEG